MYAIRDARGRVVGYAKTKAAAHRAARASRHLGSTVSRNRACTANRAGDPNPEDSNAWDRKYVVVRTTGRASRPHSFVMEHTRYGYSAVAFDARGKVVNVINSYEDRPEDYDVVLAAAKTHWPRARHLLHRPSSTGRSLNRANGDESVHDYYPASSQFMESEHDYYPANVPTQLSPPEEIVSEPAVAMSVYDQPVHEAVVEPERMRFLVSVERLA